MPSRVPLLLLLVLALLLAGCGGAKVTTTTNASGQRVLACKAKVHFARTKFLLHAGLAFGAFHRYILKPYRAGKFRKGAPGRRGALVKATAAGVFAAHELKVARNDAVCDGPTLRRLATSASAALRAVSPLAALKSGGGLASIATAASAFDSLQSKAGSNGVSIRDVNR